ncbi:MAG: GNAT family N-acetyltransferase [Pirellulales bacterium]|nr:GNAT family N-acetyltransferase [Pirellulales bacterium]
MSTLMLVRFKSLAEFIPAIEAWNDLWRRSLNGADLTAPSASGESIQLWLQHFASSSRFVALAVEQDGQLVAALPLVERRVKGAFSVGSLPTNHWCWAGDLLVDPTADVGCALEMLAAEVRRLPWPLLWFEMAPLESPRWKAFLAALKFVGSSFVASEKFRIGTVEIASQLGRNWEAYQTAWSGNHRRHMRKAVRRSNEEGGVELEIRHPTSTNDLEWLLREAFEVENRSWKGHAQTSVLSNLIVWSFYKQQAAAIARQGQLEIAFLRHRGEAIAFEYGWHAGGVYYTPKVGYDDAFSRFSPGQVLRALRYEKAFADHNVRSIDFYGPLSEATAKWATRTYPVSRLVVETGGTGGRTLLWAYQNLWGGVRKWRRRGEESKRLDIVQVDEAEPAPLDAQG